MKLFDLTSATQTGELIDFRDSRGRLAAYFMWGSSDGKFLAHTIPRGVAQAGINLADVAGADYLDINVGIPVFSRKAVEVFRRCADGEMTFHPCSIECQGQVLPFYLARIAKRRVLVDKARSYFRPLTDGEQILSGAVFHATVDEDFLIARDVEFPQHMAVTSAFRELCHAHQLTIAFLECRQ